MHREFIVLSNQINLKLPNKSFQCGFCNTTVSSVKGYKLGHSSLCRSEYVIFVKNPHRYNGELMVSLVTRTIGFD